MKVLCIGGVSYDITLPVDEFPVENKKKIIKSIVECGGGSAYNAANLLSKWNIDTYFAGLVGNDNYGKKITEEIKISRINKKYFKTSEEIETPVSFIINNQSNSSRTIITHRGGRKDLAPMVITDNFDIIYLDGHEARFAKSAIAANGAALKIIDAGRCDKDTVELAKLCDYVICSQDFAEDYTGLLVDFDDLDTICDIYDKLTIDFKGKVIITLGESGSFVELNGYKLIPTINVNSVDSTGAGDIYHGAFVYSIINGFDLIKSMKIANIAGGLSTLKIGAFNSIPRYGDVLEVYDELIK